MKSISFLFLLAISFLVIPSCNTAKDSGDDQCKHSGTVKDYTGLDGCKWMIEMSNGEKLQPISETGEALPFFDGQLIKFSYKEVKDGMSICMAGKMVRLTCISTTDVAPETPNPCLETPESVMSIAWMKREIEKSDIDAVYETVIEDARAYYFHNSKCCDQLSFLFDCQGNKLCINGGITGGDCFEMHGNLDPKKMKQVWTAPANNK